MSYAVVVPTTGRRGLTRLLTALDKGDDPPPAEIVVVDDRRQPQPPLNLPDTRVPLRVLCSGGRGPAAARNRGWRSVETDWVVFMGDGVTPAPDWPARLAVDLADLPDDVAGSQGTVRVPARTDDPANEWLPDTAESAYASRLTADIAYRRSALVTGRGFDERFHRAYREDDDLALRLAAAGLRIVRGTREVIHPAPPDGFLAEVRDEAGDADDVLMRRIHGPGWRERTGTPADRFARHLWTCGAAAATVAAAGGGRRLTAAAAALAWAGLTAEFVSAHLQPGRRTTAETLRALAAGVALPPAAVAHRIAGEIRARRVRPPLPAAVLFDRDGTLIDDAQDKGDPDAVVTVRGAREALARLRDLGVPIGVVTHQPGIARGVVERDEVAQVNHRVETLLGPFDAWEICPHTPDDACMCRQPRPGLIKRAAATLGVAPEECVVIGDIGGDVAAAQAAGARGILVPTRRTDPEELVSTAEVASDLVTAVELAIDRRRF